MEQKLLGANAVQIKQTPGLLAGEAVALVWLH